MFPKLADLFARKPLPIGIDFGSDQLRAAQIAQDGDGYRLVGTAAIDVPATLGHEPAARSDFFARNIRELLSLASFRGRDVVLSLPACLMAAQHLRVPKMDDASLKQTLPYEVKGKFPVDLGQCLLRHIVAGEVFQDQQQKLEVICLAAPRDAVQLCLNAAEKARLNVVGMNVEPTTLVDSFHLLWRRKTDAEQTLAFIDMGHHSTRIVISRGRQVLFVRSIAFGGQRLFEAVGKHATCTPAESRTKYRELSDSLLPPAKATPAPAPVAEPDPVEASENSSFALLGIATAKAERRQAVGPTVAAALPPDSPAQQLSDCIRKALAPVVEEVQWSRRYHEATFPSLPVERLVFVGGLAASKYTCQHLSQQLSLPGQIGDPLNRLLRDTPDPATDGHCWSIAIGLSLSPLAAATPAKSAAA
jgi:type IV pilus assembly protein PilM